jgi:hypothetical protein
MGSSALTVDSLKKWLLQDVAYLSGRAGIQWNHAIVETARELRRAALPAVYFGGTLRSLLLNRILGRKGLGRPRDLDIVVADDSIQRLKQRLGDGVVRETRFGGIKVERESWQFDLWPLEATWAFKQDRTLFSTFSSLPDTTFFNLEAVAVDVWSRPGSQRNIYASDGRFFEGLLTRTIELNHEHNPFPALCVVRSLVLAKTTGFAIGPKLASYLFTYSTRVSDQELETAQRHHYGKLRLSVKDMRRLLVFIRESVRRDGTPLRLELPLGQQLALWDDVDPWPRFKFHVVAKRADRG